LAGANIDVTKHGGGQESNEKFQLPIVKLAGGVGYDRANDLWRLTVAAPEDLDAA
jgi:hypothetical protein